MTTIKRNWLKKQIENGKIEVKCNLHLTDDYAFDNSVNFGKTDWMPARISRPTYRKVTLQNGNEIDIVDNHDAIDGYMNMRDHEFTGKPGHAYQNSDGTINLYVHSNLSYTMRIIG